MPKKATSAATEDKQVSEAAFLQSFNKKKASADAAAKSARPSGFLDDKQTLAKLGVGPNERKTFQGMVSKIVLSFAKNDANRPMFRFAYSITSDDRSIDGTVVSNQYIIEEKTKKDTGEVWKTEEEAEAEVYYEFQGLGEDTSRWGKDARAKAVKAAKDHTKAKTPVSITIAHWTKGEGASYKSGMNVIINPALDDSNSDLDDTTEEAPDDGFDSADWIGGWVTFESDEYGTIRMKVESYDEESHTFSGTSDTNERWEEDYAPSADVVEWAENQDD